MGSADVNAYVRDASGDNFTSKDFRTWAGTMLAARALSCNGTAVSAAARKREVVKAVETVAQSLGNTKAVCRKSYIHPAILDSHLDGSLHEILRRHWPAARRRSTVALRVEEQAVLVVLRRTSKDSRRKAA